jgi:hypothetical protein
MGRTPEHAGMFNHGPGGHLMSTSFRHPLSVQRDTRAWQVQVWVSFGVALFLCATGLAYLPGHDLDRAFMVMGYLFCLCMVFVLAKSVRDSHLGKGDTPLWSAVVWGGFATAMALTAWGLLRMEINETYKAYLGVSWLYLVTSAFTLAKTLRDRHEADQLQTRLQGRGAAAVDSSAVQS